MFSFITINYEKHTEWETFCIADEYGLTRKKLENGLLVVWNRLCQKRITH